MKKQILLAVSLTGLISTTAMSADYYAAGDQGVASERYILKQRYNYPTVLSPDLPTPWVVDPRAVARRGILKEETNTYYERVGGPRSTFGFPAIHHTIEPQYLPQIVAYQTHEKPGTIVIDTNNRFLYLVMSGGKAKRYGIGVGKPGFEWAGAHKVTRKAKWPQWTPPREMMGREAAKGHYLPESMEGGPENPLGARALYLGSSLYRIHGTNAPWTIGSGVSSGCIRMRNEDVIDLYNRVPVGTKVIVL